MRLPLARPGRHGLHNGTVTADRADRADRSRPRARMTGPERREQLIAVGRKLFAEKGFEATSVEEVATITHREDITY